MENKIDDKKIKESVRLVWISKTLNESLAGRNRRWMEIKYKKSISKLEKLGQSKNTSTQLLKALGVSVPEIHVRKISIIKLPR